MSGVDQAWNDYANQFNSESDEWQDKPLNEIFANGYAAGIASLKRSDDDVTVSTEWLIQNGFMVVPHCHFHYRLPGYRAFYVEFKDFLFPRIYVGRGAELHIVPNMATRGRVRDLCRALGIEFW